MTVSRSHNSPRGLFHNIKFFVLCHGLVQLAQLLVSGYLKASISTIERRYGFSSQKSGVLASFNEVGNTVLIIFVSFFGSRVHRPRCIGVGAILASLGVFLIALPHFISGPYQFTGMNKTVDGHTGQNCSAHEKKAHEDVFPVLLLGQLLLGIGGVPIQPFGISYIDDFASKRDSPFYLGLLFAVTVTGPAVGFIMSSVTLRLYVDIDKLSSDAIPMERSDARWVGAWWLGFLLAATFLFLTALPYLFFPRNMPRPESPEDTNDPTSEDLASKKSEETQEVTLLQFLKSFPRTALRTLQTPIYLLVVLGQVCMAAMVAGLATFMAKFIENQFSQSASVSNMLIGGIDIPSAMLGILLGGVIMRRVALTVRGSALMCSVVVFISILTAIPLLFLGCSTPDIYGVTKILAPGNSSCSEEAFNPVCSSNQVEFRSPCHAGCRLNPSNQEYIYSNCSYAGDVQPRSCGSGCSNRLVPFMIFSSMTCIIASLSQTPSFMMILRTVKAEDKSFALGIQFMLFRVLAFLPAPVLYGRAIDSTCIFWGSKCQIKRSCHYYNLDQFRQRFLGLQVFFIAGGMLCFFLSYLVIRKNAKQSEGPANGSGIKERDLQNSLSQQMLLKDPESHQDAVEKV
ncbi:solute carrier organic anion transporter family member 2B1 isoform X1 [Denticeps clupeoides]|uniref:solute carrier organic anion transporter family member 2B1 isoform X1 n=1 Tax=Denticeps clupeoides TaxID=299321 RepID=UPI0010A4EDB2|nr:solute carrier organic anion transporter family member 2B1-like isoform X1 [Denticeps clupeoides]